MKTLMEINSEITGVPVGEIADSNLDFSRLLIRAAFEEIRPKIKQMGNTDFDNGFDACKFVFHENLLKFLGELDQNAEELLK